MTSRYGGISTGKKIRAEDGSERTVYRGERGGSFYVYKSQKISLSRSKSPVASWVSKKFGTNWLYEPQVKGLIFSHLSLADAARDGNLEVVKFLVEEKKADIHVEDDLALRWAAKNGQLNIVKFLVEKGANVHANDDTALQWAVHEGHWGVVKFLIEKGANIHVDNDLPVRWAEDLAVLKFLVEKGANIHAYNDMALADAAERGQMNKVKFLVENGANIRARRVLQWAVENDHFAVVKFLVQKGAKVRDELATAAAHGNLEMVKFLAKNGGRDYVTARWYAQNYGHSDVVKFLTVGIRLN